MSAIAISPADEWASTPNLEDADRYEIVDGVKVELPPMSTDATGVAVDLAYALTTHGLAQKHGKAYTEMLFRLPLPVDRNRRPDVAYVTFARWPKDRPRPSTNGWVVLPELAVEVVSPFDIAEDIRTKVAEYFSAGIRLVWVIYPKPQLVDVFEANKLNRTLTRDDELDGETVIPDFRLPLRDLFIGEPTTAR